ncbi:MAG: hypothetical protein GWP19_16245 [Planctomycetia bacterium]|nr:hypothetical protein [Planctomycetia bacterium]
MFDEAEIWVVEALPSVVNPVAVNVPPVFIFVEIVVAAYDIKVTANIEIATIATVLIIFLQSFLIFFIWID